MTNVTNTTLPLPNSSGGGVIPVVGLGVWLAGRGGETREAVLTAIKNGYRHVDTARAYGNEAEVGEAIRSCGVPRAELFITTKLWNDDHGYDEALRAFEASQKRLGLDYVDLYLIHWPAGEKRRDAWRALEKLKADGLAKHIGVSNYHVRHLNEMFDYAKDLPAVNQIEVHPFLQHRDTRKLCAEKKIVVEAYSPLTHAQRIDDPAITAIAKSIGKTNAQVLLRWSIQNGMVTLPKSVKEHRIIENAAIFDFELDDASMQKLDALEEANATGGDARKRA